MVVDTVVDQMEDIRGCRLILCLYHITKHRTSEAIGFRCDRIVFQLNFIFFCPG